MCCPLISRDEIADFHVNCRVKSCRTRRHRVITSLCEIRVSSDSRGMIDVTLVSLDFRFSIAVQQLQGRNNVQRWTKEVFEHAR